MSGTGGTAAGVGRALREAAAAAGAAAPPEIIVVEPELSRVLSGGQHHNGHGVTGIGAGVPLAFVAAAGEAAGGKFAPDAYEAAALGDALDAARDLGLTAGVLAGPSSGAALCVARRVARRLGPKSRVVVVLPSAGERYLTHPLFDAARREAESELRRVVAPGRSDAAAELAKLRRETAPARRAPPPPAVVDARAAS